MMKTLYLLLTALLMAKVALIGCSPFAGHPLKQASAVNLDFEYHSFDEYIDKTRKQVSANRYFLTSDESAELAANTPYEMKAENRSDVEADSQAADKGVLLIHGLGDSPYSFIDISAALAAQGYLVRTVLLPGHGTRPGDMTSANYQEWKSVVAKQVDLLYQEVSKVYLGGFSTGANLAYIHGVKDQRIKGLILFSPGFKSDETLIGLTPFLTLFRPWLVDVDFEKEKNYARYRMVPTNGFAQYYHSSDEALGYLTRRGFDRPVFIALSEHDSVIDSDFIRRSFPRWFPHWNSQLMWFGSSPDQQINNIHYVNSHFPDMQVRNMSHMGLLFAPDNPYYGRSGSQRICHNGMELTPQRYRRCQAGSDVWFSAYGAYGSSNKNDEENNSETIYARLTFNPRFDQMMAAVFSVLNPDARVD